MSVSVLPSSRGKTAKANLASFVNRARNDVAAFGTDLDFGAPVWDVTETHVARASAMHGTARLYFTTHEGGTSKGMDGRTPMQEPFASFLKAMIRLSEERKHVSAQIHATMIRAGRYLYDATAACGHDPCNLVPGHFQTAANACARREEPGSAYRVGLALVAIADWLNRYNTGKVRIDFRNPFKRVTHDGTRIGREAEERRADRLPGKDALDALASIANLAVDPDDVLRIRCVELLVCGGWRINEILTVRADCEVTEGATENGNPMLDAEGNQIQRYGISYFGEKGAGARIKWIPSPMVDVARRAIADIRRITQPARETLEWMAANPGRARLPDGWHEGALDARYTRAEIARMFKFKQKTAGWELAKNYGIPGQGSPWTAARADVEAALLARQGEIGRTGVPLRREQYLFVMPRNWAHRTRGVISSVIDVVTDQHISDFIAGREGVGTVFSRFGFTGADETPLEITTHQFRHWLNTLAQSGGMGQMEIARWSGRKDVGQNAEYDHRSGFEMAARAREMLAKGKVHGPIALIHDSLPPVRREAFRDMQFTTGHTTDIGMCTNDWSLAPCMEHGGCAGCAQHLVVKGDKSQLSRAETQLEEHARLLRHAEEEASEETYGASNYVTHHRRTLDALLRIVAVHGDQSIPDGDLVHMNLGTARDPRRTLDNGDNRCRG